MGEISLGMAKYFCLFGVGALIKQTNISESVT